MDRKDACQACHHANSSHIPRTERTSSDRHNRILRSLMKNVALGYHSCSFNRLGTDSGFDRHTNRVQGSSGNVAGRMSTSPTQPLRYHPSSLFASGSNLYGDKCSVAGATGPAPSPTLKPPWMDRNHSIPFSCILHFLESFWNMTIWAVDRDSA